MVELFDLKNPVNRSRICGKSIEQTQSDFSRWKTISENAKKECEAICKYVNDKVQVVLVYNDTKEKVADVVMSVAREYDSYGDDYYYYVEPILLFPDESKYAFEDYFTERAFGNLIRKVEELAEDFANLVY